MTGFCNHHRSLTQSSRGSSPLTPFFVSFVIEPNEDRLVWLLLFYVYFRIAPQARTAGERLVVIIRDPLRCVIESYLAFYRRGNSLISSLGNLFLLSLLFLSLIPAAHIHRVLATHYLRIFFLAEKRFCRCRM